MLQPSSPALIAPGVLIAGKYRLIRPIGEGAMGSVWAATNETTSRAVALKLLTRPEREFRLRLEREARALGTLKHKNIIDIHDVGQTDAGDPFLVMELLTGETVAEMLVRKRRVDVATAARIGRDAAKALSAAHAVPIIHRDLKPANIFLHQVAGEDAPVVKVLDFGVAKNLAASDGLHTVAGGAVGSPLYMSPEQVKADRDIDHRADIWALGVVMFEMLAGRRPFEGDAGKVFTTIVSGEIPTVDRYVRLIDPALVQVVVRCMRQRREERYATAAELAAALDPFTTAAPASDPMNISGNDWKRASSPSHPEAGVPAVARTGSSPELSQAHDLDDAVTLPLKPDVARAVMQQVAQRGGSSPEVQAPLDADTEPVWARGGTVKMTPEVAKRVRQAMPPAAVPAEFMATAPLPAMPGMVGVASTTTPLVQGPRGAIDSVASPLRTTGAALLDERRRRKRVAGAIAGVLLGGLIAGGVLFALTGGEPAPADQPAAPESSAQAVPAPPAEKPSGAIVDVPASEPTATATASAATTPPGASPAASGKEQPRGQAAPPADSRRSPAAAPTPTGTQAPKKAENPCKGLKLLELDKCQKKYDPYKL